MVTLLTQGMYCLYSTPAQCNWVACNHFFITLIIKITWRAQCRCDESPVSSTRVTSVKASMTWLEHKLVICGKHLIWLSLWLNSTSQGRKSISSSLRKASLSEQLSSIQWPPCARKHKEKRVRKRNFNVPWLWSQLDPGDEAVLYPPQVIPYGIHGMEGGGWWIPWTFQMDSMDFPDGFHGISRSFHGLSTWIPYCFHSGVHMEWVHGLEFPNGFHTV